MARTHSKHDLLCTLSQQTSQPSARCTVRRCARGTVFWKQQCAHAANQTPNAAEGIIPNASDLYQRWYAQCAWLYCRQHTRSCGSERTNKSVEFTCRTACVRVRVQIMNPFLLTSYSFDKHHGKAAEHDTSLVSIVMCHRFVWPVPTPACAG